MNTKYIFFVLSVHKILNLSGELSGKSAVYASLHVTQYPHLSTCLISVDNHRLSNRQLRSNCSQVALAQLAMIGLETYHFTYHLPSIVGKRLIGLGHFVGIFLLFEGCTGIIIGIHELSRKPVSHAFSRARPGGADNPPHAKGFAP